jgi:GNAT superfamily N-acetyltransferase
MTERIQIPATEETQESVPFLSDTSLQEFPTDMTVGETKGGSPLYTFATTGGEVIVQLPLPNPENPNLDPKAWALISNLAVEEEYRGQGIATDLMRTAAREMAALGVPRLDSVVVSSVAMRNRSRVFGPDKSDIRDAGYDNEANPIPISEAEAAASLERSEARKAIYKRRGIDPKTIHQTMGWGVSVDLTDPEVVAYLNKPLDVVEKTPRIVTEDTQHYPEEWEALAVLNEEAAVEAAAPQTAKPTLRERFTALKDGLREKTQGWRRKTATAIGVGATALALVSSGASSGEVVHAPDQPGISQEANIPPKQVDAHPEASPPQPAPAETVTLEAWNSHTGAGTVWNIAKERLTHDKGTAAPADILSYSNQIAAANHIPNPNVVHPGDKVTLPAYKGFTPDHT